MKQHTENTTKRKENATKYRNIRKIASNMQQNAEKYTNDERNICYLTGAFFLTRLLFVFGICLFPCSFVVFRGNATEYRKAQQTRRENATKYRKLQHKRKENATTYRKCTNCRENATN